MKKFLDRPFLFFSPLLGLLVLLAFLPGKVTAAEAVVEHCPALLNFNFKRLQDDVPQDLCQYAGNVVLVVNTASYCGYTGQYEGLEQLYAKYKDQGLVVSWASRLMISVRNRAAMLKSPIFATTHTL